MKTMSQAWVQFFLLWIIYAVVCTEGSEEGQDSTEKHPLPCHAAVSKQPGIHQQAFNL